MQFTPELIEEMIWVLQRVADHFEDTDAPLGLDAAAVLEKAKLQKEESCNSH